MESSGQEEGGRRGELLRRGDDAGLLLRDGRRRK